MNQMSYPSLALTSRTSSTIAASATSTLPIGAPLRTFLLAIRHSMHLVFSLLVSFMSTCNMALDDVGSLIVGAMDGRMPWPFDLHGCRAVQIYQPRNEDCLVFGGGPWNRRLSAPLEVMGACADNVHRVPSHGAGGGSTVLRGGRAVQMYQPREKGLRGFGCGSWSRRLSASLQSVCAGCAFFLHRLRFASHAAGLSNLDLCGGRAVQMYQAREEGLQASGCGFWIRRLSAPLTVMGAQGDHIHHLVSHGVAGQGPVLRGGCAVQMYQAARPLVMVVGIGGCRSPPRTGLRNRTTVAPHLMLASRASLSASTCGAVGTPLRARMSTLHLYG